METARVSNLDALLFATSLEVVLLQLRILEGSTELRARYWKIDTSDARLQHGKLVSDRELIKAVLRRTLIELVEHGEWETIKQATAQLSRKIYCAVNQELQYQELRKTRRNIIQELETKRQMWATELRNADRKMASLRDRIHDDQLNANMRLVYAEKWVVARAESLEMQYEQPRPPPPRLDHEDRVHKELLKAYAMQINERENNLSDWQQRFTTDTANINAKLTAKCEQLRLATARRLELQKLYDLHAGEMRAWLTFKRERAARLEREQRWRASATRIQSWWRGVMVRRALGAFRFLRNIKKTPAKGKKK